MQRPSRCLSWLAACAALSMPWHPGKRGATAADAPAPRAAAQQAVERGLVYLQEDAAKWRQERNCATCHHGTMTVWALQEARLRGYRVADDVFDALTSWTKERLSNLDKPRDTRPGWKMLNSPALYLSVMAQAMPGQTLISDDEQRRIAGHLVRHQEADGAWAWSSAPPQNRPPPFFESDEVATILGYMALGPQTPAAASSTSPFRESRTKALEWLRMVNSGQSTQVLAFELFRNVQEGNPVETKAFADALLKRQSADGGWGQTPDSASDAYATGQAVYFLLAAVPRDRPEINRAVQFLVDSQQAKGSWLMVPRAHPEAKPSKSLSPITHLGSAWATLALARAVPMNSRR